MLKRTATYHEFLDENGRRFVVRLNAGMHVGIVEGPFGRERVEWQKDWGRYSPLSEETAARVVQEVCTREQRRLPINRLNAELQHPGPQLRRPAEACKCHDDRQLPKGDRT